MKDIRVSEDQDERHQGINMSRKGKRAKGVF